MRDLDDLETLLRSSVPVVVIETHEEPRVVDLMERLAARRAMPLFAWTVTDGLRRVGKEYGAQLHTRDPTELLAQIKGSGTPGIYVLSDFHPYLEVFLCRPDLNRDGAVDSRDFVLFLNWFTSGDPEADYNEDGAVDSRDFTAFLNDFVAGC